MAEDRNIGVASAAASLSPVSAGAPAGAEISVQDELFDLAGPDAGATALSNMDRKKAGRPPGSPNKRTEDLRRFILARYQHPVVALAEIYTTPVDELAKFLDCDRLDAMKVAIKAAAEVAPYVDSRMPAKIQITDRDRLPSFGLEFSAAGVAVKDASGNSLTLVQIAARAKAAHNQRLGKADASGAQIDGAHDQGQVIDVVDVSDE